LKSFTFIFPSLDWEDAKANRREKVVSGNKRLFRFLCLCVVPGGFWNGYTIMTLFSFSQSTHRVDFRLETSREPVASIFMQISLHQKYDKFEGLNVFS